MSEESKQDQQYNSNNQNEHQWDDFDQLETSSEKLEEDSEISVHTITKQLSNAKIMDYVPKDDAGIPPSNLEQKLMMQKPYRRILKEPDSTYKFSYSSDTLFIQGTDNEFFDYPYRDAFEVCEEVKGKLSSEFW